MPSPPRSLCGIAVAARILVAEPSPAIAASPPTASEDEAFGAHRDLTLADLEDAVRRGAPAVEGARLEVALAAAEVRRRRTLANPRVDLGWGTLPLGTPNPPDLARPWRDIPNYGIGVEYTVPVRKRRPAIAAAQAYEAAARAELDMVARERALELAATLGEIAAATLRREGMEALAAEGRRALDLAEAGLRAKFTAPIEVDRLAIDVERTTVLLSGTEAEIAAGLAACAALVARPCGSFAGADEARDFLERWSAIVPADAPLTDRADIRALSAAIEGADAEVALARAAAYPDPTVRLGYLRDQFVISGSQRDSLNLSVSFPLPLVDRGQGGRDAARARAQHLRAISDKVIAASSARLAALRRQLAAERARREHIAGVIVPKAQAVLDDLERAAAGRLVPLTEVVHARRALRELLLQEAEAYVSTHRVVVDLLRESPPDAPAEARP